MKLSLAVHRFVFVLVTCFVTHAAMSPVCAGTEKTLPTTMSYQGYLTDLLGKPLPDGQYDFTVSLYVSSEADTPIWEEQHEKITVTNGFVQLQLGKGTPSSPLDLPFDRQYFLGIRVGSDSEMSPRMELTASPYSFRANFADEVPDSSITNEKLAPLSVTDDKIKSVGWDKITGFPHANAFKKGFATPGPVPSSVWHIRGNLRTDPSKNFVGTADSIDLSFRTNNIEAMRIHADGRVVINSKLSGSDNVVENYPLFVDSKDQGIAIRIDGIANSTNNYVYFLDDDGAAGRIEGQTLGEYGSDQVTRATNVYLAALVLAELAAIATAPVEASGIISLAAAIIYIKFLEALDRTNIGVTYSSGGADYAEWLLRLDEDEEIQAGDIVGVRSGKITKSTANAHQILAVSSNPIVLGNMPPENQEHLHEKVAFMGQVAVKVVGPVKEGDIIIPSGLEDGTGIAVSPEMMTADEYSKVVGRAWSASDNEFVKLINVAVGLNPGDIASIIKMQQVELDAIKAQLAARDSDVRKVMAELEKIKTQLNAMSNRGNLTLSLQGATEDGKPLAKAGQ